MTPFDIPNLIGVYLLSLNDYYKYKFSSLNIYDFQMINNKWLETPNNVSTHLLLLEIVN